MLWKRYLNIICLQSLNQDIQGIINPHLSTYLRLKLMQCINCSVYFGIALVNFFAFPSHCCWIICIILYETILSVTFLMLTGTDFISHNQTLAEVWLLTIRPQRILLVHFPVLNLSFYVGGTENWSFECLILRWLWGLVTFTLDFCVVLFSTKIRPIPRELSSECTRLIMWSRNQARRVVFLRSDCQGVAFFFFLLYLQVFLHLALKFSNTKSQKR